MPSLTNTLFFCASNLVTKTLAVKKIIVLDEFTNFIQPFLKRAHLSASF